MQVQHFLRATVAREYASLLGSRPFVCGSAKADAGGEQ
jgi:hypothetical protein